MNVSLKFGVRLEYISLLYIVSKNTLFPVNFELRGVHF